MMKKHIITLIVLLCIVGLLIHGPIPQDLQYHKFADKRMFFRIPNFLNVITNVPFAIIGFLGLAEVRNVKVRGLKSHILILFIGFLMLAVSSSFYHLLPNNYTLVYDRASISIISMSFLAFIIATSVNGYKSFSTLIILNLIGLVTVIYWFITEHFGQGDLRWYGMVQFFPIIAIPLILHLYKVSLAFKEIVFIILFFALAKVAEHYDEEIFITLRNSISGHSLKHLLIALSGYRMVQLVRKSHESLHTPIRNVNHT
jgi:hypothetical protein